MGCQTSSARVKVIDNFTDNSSVQQEAESFRCQVKAVRYALKDATLRCVFQEYLSTQDCGTVFLTCYLEIEDLKSQPDTALIPMLNAAMAKYQLLYEQKLSTSTTSRPTTSCGMIALWGKLKQLKSLDQSNITKTALVRALTTTQNHMLSELVEPFDEFLESPVFRQQLRAHRASNAQAHPYRQTSSCPQSQHCRDARRSDYGSPMLSAPMHGALSPSAANIKSGGSVTHFASQGWPLSGCTPGRTGSMLTELECTDLSTVLMVS
jgi:hypothetical protein